jgi:hypothetical protein
MAAVLLFIGLLAGSSLTAIYVSIGLSIVAAVFLWLGINQRPAEVPAQAGVRGGDGSRPGERGGRQRDDDTETERPGGKLASNEQPSVAEQPGEVTQQLDVMSDDLVEDSDEHVVAAAVATGADVFVVSGHPRYHLEECPAVLGNDEAESLPIGEARDLGFVPCGACQPDSEIAEAAAEPAALPHTSNGAAAPAAALGGASVAAAEPELVNAPPSVAAGEQTAAPMPPTAVAPPPAAYDPSAGQPQAQPQQWQQPRVAASPPASDQPPATQPTSVQQVVVLPGKARFHRPDCRLVSGPEPTEALDRTGAIRQGYLACAICKP